MAGGGRGEERRKGRTASLTEMLWGAGVWLAALGWAGECLGREVGVNRSARGGPWPWLQKLPAACEEHRAVRCQRRGVKPLTLSQRIWVCVQQR